MALPNKCPNHLLIVLIGIFSADQISQGLYINNIGYLFTKLEKMWAKYGTVGQNVGEKVQFTEVGHKAF